MFIKVIPRRAQYYFRIVSKLKTATHVFRHDVRVCTYVTYPQENIVMDYEMKCDMLTSRSAMLDTQFGQTKDNGPNFQFEITFNKNMTPRRRNGDMVDANNVLDTSLFLQAQKRNFHGVTRISISSEGQLASLYWIRMHAFAIFYLTLQRQIHA